MRVVHDRDTGSPARLGRRRRENLTREMAPRLAVLAEPGASQCSDAARRGTGGAMPGAVEPAAEAEAAAAAVSHRRPTTAAERRRMYRDLALSLRCGLRDAAAGFSFLRLRGLRALLRALRSTAADADPDAGLFRDTQSIRDLQVIPVLFEHSLRKAAATGTGTGTGTGGDKVLTVAQVLGMEPAAGRLRNPASDSEVVLALRVLEGCSLLCSACAAAAHRYNAVKVVLNILMTRGILEQRACLDTLLALLVDCSENLTDFKEQDGLNKIAAIVKDANRDDHVRLKCSEFLLLYSGNAKENCGVASESNMQQDLEKVFGEKCASFICSMNLFSSTLDSQMRQSELSFLAEHVLDYM